MKEISTSLSYSKLCNHGNSLKYNGMCYFVRFISYIYSGLEFHISKDKGLFHPPAVCECKSGCRKKNDLDFKIERGFVVYTTYYLYLCKV